MKLSDELAPDYTFHLPDDRTMRNSESISFGSVLLKMVSYNNESLPNVVNKTG